VNAVRLIRQSAILGTFAACVVGIIWLYHPVCVALSADDVARFRQWQPIEERKDRQMFWRVFQKRGDQWYQCKSWVSRAFFF